MSLAVGSSTRAHLHGVATAGPEVTATRWVHGRGDVALQDDPQSPPGRVDAGRSREQGLGVGMAGRAEELLDRPFLDDASEVHDGHSVAERAHEIEVVGDEQVGDAQAVLQVAQEVDDLHLGRHVQRAERLVERQQLGFGGQGPGDGRPLQLTAGDLAWTAPGERRRETNLVEQFSRPLLTCGAIRARCGPRAPRPRSTRWWRVDRRRNRDPGRPAASSGARSADGHP